MSEQKRTKQIAAYESMATWCELWAFKARRRGRVQLAEEYKKLVKLWGQKAAEAKRTGATSGRSDG